MPRITAIASIGFLVSACFALAAPIKAVQQTNLIGQATAGMYVISATGVSMGDRIDVTYTLPAPGSLPITIKDVGTIGQGGETTIALAVPKGTAITFFNSSEGLPAPGIKATAYFTPPGDRVITPLTVLAGSTATLGTSTLALTGNFTTVATNVDYDPASPTYGNLSGFFPAAAFSIQGAGTGGSVLLSLSGDMPWTVNLASVWKPDLGTRLAGGIPVPFSAPLSGTLTSGAGSTAFSGTSTGNVTFFNGDVETINATFDFTSALGPLRGTLSASGQSLVTTPEPATAALCGVVLIGLALLGQRNA